MYISPRVKELVEGVGGENEQGAEMAGAGEDILERVMGCDTLKGQSWSWNLGS